MTRITFISIVCFVLFVSTQSYALTGLGIGARGGIVANYDNPELSFEQIRVIDINELTMIGVHARITSLPVFTYEVVAEYSWTTEEYRVLGYDLSVKVRDFMVGGNVKYMLKTPLLAPYVGGGIATHQMTYEFEPSLGGILGTPDIMVPSDGPKFGIHGLGGVSLNLPASPLEFFIEGRFGKISGEDESANYSSVYAGVTLKFL